MSFLHHDETVRSDRITDSVRRSNRAPPGGQSSIFFGEYDPNDYKKSSTYSLSMNDSSCNEFPSSQPNSSRVGSHLHRGSNVFTTDDNSLDKAYMSNRRPVSQQRQTVDVFNSDGTASSEINSSHRRLLSPNSKIDIYGRQNPPADIPAKRVIRKGDSNIFEENDHIPDRLGKSYSHSPGYNRKNSRGSFIFENNDGNSNNQPESGGRRRLTPAYQADTDIFGHGANSYRQPTDYRTTSRCRSPHRKYAEERPSPKRERSDTTQSLGALLKGSAGVTSTHTALHGSRLDSEVGDTLTDDSQAHHQNSTRRYSRSFQSSIVLN